MVIYDAAQPVDPHVFIRGNPGRPGPAVPRRFLRLLAGVRPPAVPEGQRPAGAGPGDRRPQEPADRARSGQPRLAVALRQGAGRHAQRLRPAERPAQPSRAARLPGRANSSPPAGRSRALHRLIMLSSTYRQRSDPRTTGSARPGKPPALAVQSPAARFRVDARLAPGRLGRARSRDRRARRVDHRAPFSRAARFTASSTARTWTDCTARSTSPCPTRPAPGGS